MSFVSKLFRKLPMVESVRAAADGWGVLSYITGGFYIAGAFAMSAWAWTVSHLPLWAIGTLFLFLIAVALAATNFTYGIILKRKTARAIDGIVSIDREVLADQLADISHKIATLVGEFRGPMQEAWWRDADHRDPMSMRDTHSRVEGQLIDRYSSRYAADVWVLIRRASKVIAIDQSDIWQISHGIRGEHDLAHLYILLASLSDDVRTPKSPLPMTDRRREQIALTAGAPAPQLPSEPAP